MIVPPDSSISYLSGGARQIDALSFGDNSVLDVTEGNSLEVTGVGVIRGTIQADGLGSGFRAPGGGVVLEGHPRLLSVSGSNVEVGSGAYQWAGFNGDAELLLADGDGSKLDLRNVGVLSVSPGNGSRTYTIRATERGDIDLSGLVSLSGPGSDDWLRLVITTGGRIQLGALQNIAGRVRLDVRVPNFELPALERAVDTEFLFGSNVVAAVPKVLGFAGGRVSLGESSSLAAPSLLTISGVGFELDDAASFTAASLVAMDAVPVSLAGSASFTAPSLTVYRDSDIPVTPGRSFVSPPLMDITRSRISVGGGAEFSVAATRYEVPEQWNRYDYYDGSYYVNSLLTADGPGSLLDISSLQTLRIEGYSDNRAYDVTAVNQGVIDLSGLETVMGCRDGWGWLRFLISAGSDVRLDALREASRRTWFNIEVPDYSLPSLETASLSRFSLSDGTTLSMPQLEQMEGCFFDWGFNSRVTAPKLLDFQDGALSLRPGRIWDVPAFTNITRSRISVGGGAEFSVAATRYEVPEQWNRYDYYDGSYYVNSLLTADGPSSLLDVSSLQTLRIEGYSDNRAYDVTAVNQGVIDLSGLETVMGCRDGWGWLRFLISAGSDIRLDALREASRRTWFNIEVPDYSLPSLETASLSRFSLSDGTTLSMPQLEQMEGCFFDWGFNSRVTAPKLLDFQDGALSLRPGRIWDVPAFTNITRSRISVGGGAEFSVAATRYEVPEQWNRYDYHDGSYYVNSLLTADGPGSLLDVSSLQTLRIEGYSDNRAYDVTAVNQGVIDLSGLETVMGCRDGWGWLRVEAAGGTLVLGDVDVSRRAWLSASSEKGILDLGGASLDELTRISVQDRGLLRVGGDFEFEIQNPDSLVVENAYLQMGGVNPQRLEVGGQDLGPAGATTRNFGYSQLIVGETNRTSVVRLVDAIDNGHRGSGGDPECLYLYGMDGAGLRLLHGSRLVLNGLSVYALVNGAMRSLADLIPDGRNSAAFGDGFVARTGGPKVMDMTPATALVPPVDSVQISLDIAIDETTFTVDDVAVEGPSGAIPVTGIAKEDANTYRILFASQTADGVYSVRVGPHVDELAGNLFGMDQDSDGLGGEVDEDVFVGTFTLDGDAPQVIGAFAVQNGTKVGVRFDEPVDAQGGASTATYAVNGVSPVSAELREDGRSVVLTVPALVGEAFDFTVTDVADLLGNHAAREFTGTILPLEHRDLGSPREAGSVLTFDGIGFENVAGGSGIWNAQDAGQWLFERRVGDFDLRMQLESLKKTGSWTQAGLMARESTDANSVHVFAHVQYGTGYNRYAAGYRTAAGGDTAYWPETPTATAVPVPNAWLRLKREGDVFVALWGTNGTDWVEYARLAQSMPDSLLVGLATSAVNNNAGQATTAVYDNYGDLSPGFVTPPQDQSLASGATAIFGATVRGEAPLSYQWYHDGEPISGATLATLELSNVQADDVGDYRVEVSNGWGTNLSTVATLSVDGIGVDGGLEADVSPSPRGDGSVTIQDWVKAGLFVAALEDPVNSSQFQRADCAPAPCGDGRLSVADWTQAGLYAAALVEPVPTACGDIEPVARVALASAVEAANAPDGTARVVWLETEAAHNGSPVEVRVLLAAQGNENAVGLSVAFDPGALRFVSVASGSATGDAFLQVNDRQASEGRIGLALAKAAGMVFPAGETEIARLEFVALTPGESSALEFGTTPIAREVVSAAAEVLDARFVGATIDAGVGPRLESLGVVEDGGFEFEFAAEAGSGWIIEVSEDLQFWSELTRQLAVDGTVHFMDDAPANQGQRFYRLRLVE
ncbi:MAG: hypothetical protein H7A46_16895 [Verrucomicrobiales bacterium]|nr:hypothetical protein [Verrucomicrobiales bacterium]